MLHGRCQAEPLVVGLILSGLPFLVLLHLLDVSCVNITVDVISKKSFIYTTKPKSYQFLHNVAVRAVLLPPHLVLSKPLFLYSCIFESCLKTCLIYCGQGHR